MMKTIRKYAFEEFLAAISTSSGATKHSKGFIIVYFLFMGLMVDLIESFVIIDNIGDF